MTPAAVLFCGFLRVDIALQAMQHALVAAFDLVADGVQLRVAKVLVGHAIGDALGV